MDFETTHYDTGDAIATITLNRPQHLNAIALPMPDEIERAVERACRDRAVRVIVSKARGGRSARASTSRRTSRT